MIKAYIEAIEYYIPQNKEINDPQDKLTAKVGIYSKGIAAEDEYASDMAIKAGEKLFESNNINRNDINFLIYCTQSPDYLLPTTACILQSRMNLPTSCGAFDINLGCSGYVYGLSVAKGLIESGIAKNVLLITADTYSKYTNPNDRSVRFLFGDAAAATLVSSIESEIDLIGPFVFGTDGTGYDNLIVPAGGLREPVSSQSFIESVDAFGNSRHRGNLYMNGPEIFNFTLREIPPAINDLLTKSNVSLDDYNYFVFHQANKYMLEHLRRKLGIVPEKFLIKLDDCGNTVSSTIPITLKAFETDLQDNAQLMLFGFGVGYSWAGCNLIWKN